MSDKSEHPPLPQAFADLGVRPSILRALAELKFVEPSEIQKMLIPRALAGIDLLGQARTGTGKTAAFGIPILQRATRGLATQGIILVPTRELAVQVNTEIERLAVHTPIRTIAVYGGQRIVAQMKFLRHGPEVLVGTPGRVIDLLDRRVINFDNVRFVVLDEVDRMLDIGFRDDIRNILSRVKGIRRRLRPGDDDGGAGRESYGGDRAASAAPASPPAEPSSGGAPQGSAPQDTGGYAHDDYDVPRGILASTDNVQTIFVSATISPDIERLGRQYMREPVEKLVVPGADDSPTVEHVEQYYLSAQPWDKYRALRTLLERENPDLAIVFTRTKRGAEKLARKLHADGIECREIHGNLNQEKRERVMKNFRTGKFDVLIATDLASRGIDVADISHIINYDVPEDPEVYVHRIGRTARMGAKGKAFTLVSSDQGGELTKIELLINMMIPQATLEGFTPSPTPSDWITDKPAPSDPSRPVVSRFERPYGAAPAASSTPGSAAGSATANAPVQLTAPPRTLGSKIPINRRHKRRR
jgi:superfamily II DNA/RNA helicase